MEKHIKDVKRIFRSVFVILCLSVAAGCGSSPSPTPEGSINQSDAIASQLFFDDFSYEDVTALTENGWIVRSGQGWPGVIGAFFRAENVSFVDYPNPLGNRLLRMTSSTDGTSENTYQTQICHQRKYLDGTYAARLRFSDEPVSGPDGDQIVQTFYTITPYDEPLNPDYSEMDFEYLPNGGWGGPATRMHFTTWETVRIEPWLANNASNSFQESLSSWHTLVAQVTGSTVRYFVDGKLTAQHGGEFYPDAPMSINFNLWFIDGGQINSDQVRSYQEDIDWVYHEAGIILTPQEVNEKVQAFREAGTKFQDTVPAWSPSFDSLCDL